MTRSNDHYVHLLKTVHDRLVERAKILFSIEKDAQLIRLIETRNTTETTRNLIVQHRIDTSDMSGMNHDRQLALLGRQLEIERFLTDWDRYSDRKDEIMRR